MNILQIEPIFWVFTAIIVVLFQINWRWSRTTYFGFLNILILSAILGWQASLMVLGIATFVSWSASVAEMKAPQYKGRIMKAVVIAVVASLLCHKIMIEIARNSDPGSFDGIGAYGLDFLSLLEDIAYAYVGLRAWDAALKIGQGSRILSPLAMSGYLAPFFMLPAGPINVYGAHLEVDDSLPPQPTTIWFVDGLELIVRGLFIKIVIAELLRLFVVGLGSQWPTGSVLDSGLIFFFVYFDFWGYSLIALGIGVLLGIPTPVNFNAPLLSRTLTEFWTRWHISLGDLVRRVIFNPLQMLLLRRSKGRHYYVVNAICLAMTFGFVGIWHRPTLAFLAWGLSVALVMAIEKPIRDKVFLPQFRRRPYLLRIARIVGPFYVVSVIVFSLHLTAIPQMVGGS